VLANLITLKAGYDAAVTGDKDGDRQSIVSFYRELQPQVEAVNALADNHGDLKANDAYLRLIDAYKESINQTTNAPERLPAERRGLQRGSASSALHPRRLRTGFHEDRGQHHR
jgi:hypothetical protein